MNRTIFKLRCTIPTLSMVKLFKGTKKNKSWIRSVEFLMIHFDN